jgi:hypothetical protein
VHGVDQHVTAATAVSGGAGVFLLSGSGNLFYLDASRTRVEAVLAPTIPFTALAQDGLVPARSALGVTAGTSLIACQLEGKADGQP